MDQLLPLPLLSLVGKIENNIRYFLWDIIFFDKTEETLTGCIKTAKASFFVVFA